MSPSRRRSAVHELQVKFEVSERRACKVVGQPRSSQRSESNPRDDECSLVRRMLQLVHKFPRYGVRRIAALLRRESWRASATRIYRLWRREGLKVPQKKQKRRRLGNSTNGCHRHCAQHRNHVWCWDFAFDHTSSGSTLKWFSVVDEFTRENLTLKVDRNITSEDVIDALAELFVVYGVPKHIRSDNGPEFIAEAIRRWFEQLDIKALYIEPGSPWENGYAESFFSRFRDEFLALEEFENLKSARKLTKAWREDYNHHRPHSSLGYLPPVEFAAHCASSVRAAPSLRKHSDESEVTLIP